MTNLPLMFFLFVEFNATLNNISVYIEAVRFIGGGNGGSGGESHRPVANN
jgi:hypothetical protein